MNRILPITLLFLALLFLIPSVFAQMMGGPDVHGYVWEDSGGAGNPFSFDWVDITNTGTQLTGLADDNSVGPVSMGMTFSYYWSTYSELRVGSNGWIGFGEADNLAPCFPTIPTPGGLGDNLVFPLLADLTFAGTGNPARVFVQNDGSGRFIVSYHDVPFRIDQAPGYQGSNTFQVIFDQNDSTIIFQYLQMEATAPDDPDCVADVGVGIENLTGNIGLEVFNGAMPTSSYAIRFSPPSAISLLIPDLTPTQLLNQGSAGVFAMVGDDHPIEGKIAHVGNEDATSAFSATATVRDEAQNTVYTQTENLSSMSAGDELLVDFGSHNFANPGVYSMEVAVASPDDINPGNNRKEALIVVVDTSGLTEIPLAYMDEQSSDGTLSWTDEVSYNGVGVQYHPPFYPATLKAVEYFTVPSMSGAQEDGYIVEVWSEDASSGRPDVIMYSDTVEEGTYAIGWNRTTLPAPITIQEGGFYLVWRQAGRNAGIGTSASGPISRRNLELRGEAWATYRNNEVEDIMMKAILEPSSSTSGINQEDKIDFAFFPNPTNGLVQLEGGIPSQIEIQDLRGSCLMRVNGPVDQLDVSDLPGGVYLVRAWIGDRQVVRRLVKVE